MKNAIILVLGIFIVILMNCISVSSYSINPGHPRIFITQANIDDIRARCAGTGIQGDYYSRIKSGCDYAINNSWSSGDTINNPLLAYSFVAVMGEVPGYDYEISYNGKTGIEAYAEKGKELLKQQTDYYSTRVAGHYSPTLTVTAAYDWLYPYFDSDEKTAIVNNIVSHQDIAFEYALSGPNGYLWDECFHSACLKNTAYPVMCAAYYGDGIADLKAQQYCDEFDTRWVDTIFPVWNRVTRGGGAPFGADYSGIWIKYVFTPLEIWNSATSGSLRTTYDGFPNYNLFFQMYNLIPYVTYLHCETSESPCWGSSGWDARRLKTYGLFRETGSTIAKYSDYPLPQFHTMAYQRPYDLHSITVLDEKGYSDYAKAAQWALLFHGSQETPASSTELSKGPYRTTGEYSASLLWDIVLRDSSIEPISPVELNLPTSHFFGTTNTGPDIGDDFSEGSPEGVGIVTSRSAWEDTDATFIFYKHTPYAAIHYYRDAGQFQVYKDGWLAIDSGQYTECDSGDTQHSAHYTRTTASKNSLLIYDPDEIWNGGTYHDSFRVAGNSGGQRDEYVGTVEGILNVQSDSRQFYGGIVNYQYEEDGFTYIDSDLTRAYQSIAYNDEDNNAKVSKVTRQLVYFPENHILVFDRINSTDGEFPKRWLLHSVYRPELDGSETFSGTIQYSTNIPEKPGGVSLQGDEDAGISESYDTDIFYVDGYNFELPENTPATGRLFVKTLLPKDRIHRVIGGPGYEFMNAEYNNYPIDNEGCDPTWREQYPEHGQWRIEVEPTGADYHKMFNTFMHVLETSEQTKTSMAETTLIDAGNMKGALIKEPSKPSIVLFSSDTSQVGSVTYEADYLSSQTGRHLITGLVPNVNYKIYKNGIEIDCKLSSDQGTVYFESTGGSTFSLSTAALEDCESIGGACKDDSCSAYTDCNSLAGICSTGYCCQGSCEAASSCSSGADEDNSGEVSMDELIVFIGGWKTGSVTIAQVLEAIGEWKNGC